MRELYRAAEQKPEPRPARAPRGSGCKRKVDLKAARQEEDAVDRSARRHVEEMDASELGCELMRPILEDVLDGRGVIDAEREVEVGPAVARTVGEAADHGAGDHTRIGLRHAEHVVAHAVAVLDAEHGADARRPG